MRITQRLLLAATLCAGSLLAQRPNVAEGGILNVASYTFAGLPNHGIAQGSMFIIYGTNIGPATPSAFTQFPLPTNLGGAAVRVTVGGQTVDAFIVRASANEIVAILPSNTPAGEGTLTVSFNGQASNSATIRVVRAAFGMFTLNQAGSGPAIVQNANDDGSLVINTYNAPARPGQLVVLWGTGLGAVSGDEAGGPRPGNLSTDLNVFVGGKSANVSYKGRSGCCSGVDQINFTVPADVEGCSVPIIVQTGDIVSNVGTIAVARTGNSCSDPGGITGQELIDAQQRGTLRIGSVTLSKTTTKISAAGISFDSKIDSGSAAFSSYDFNNLIRATGFGTGSASSFGACTVYTFRGMSPAVVDPIRSTPLDAGPVINVNGPNGAKQLRKQGEFYSGELGGGVQIPGAPAPSPEYLTSGTYNVDNGGGGSGNNSVGPFRTQITLPAEFKWENIDAITSVTRSSGLPISWSGGSLQGSVYIIGSSSRGNSNVGASFFCIAKVSDGSFTVPSYILLALPESTGPNNVGSLGVFATTPPARFTATGLDFGTLTFSDSKFKTVPYR